MPDKSGSKNGPIGIHIIGNVTDVKISNSKFGPGVTGVLMEERNGLAPSNVRLSKNEFQSHPMQQPIVSEKKGWLREYWLQLSVAITLALGGLVWNYVFGS